MFSIVYGVLGIVSLIVLVIYASIKKEKDESRLNRALENIQMKIIYIFLIILIAITFYYQ